MKEAANRHMIDFEAWLNAYGHAWETGDPDAVVSLFSETAAYHETPFEAPMVGHDAIRRYWQEGAGQAQRDVQFDVTVLAVEGATGIARWTASFVRVPSGVRVDLDGILTAHFDASGRCTVFREWWHRQEHNPDSIS